MRKRIRESKKMKGMKRTGLFKAFSDGPLNHSAISAS